MSILGCGWYGFALAKSLVSNGYSVKGSTTTVAKLAVIEREGIEPFLIDFDPEKSHNDSSFFESDILIISLPPKRHSGEHNEYPEKIRRIVEAAQSGKVQKILMISSTSVYGDVNRRILQGEIPVPDTESGIAILAAEKIVQGTQNINSTILRFGGLIGPGRNLAKFFAGKKDIANGLSPVNLLHLEDCIQLTQHIIATDAFGYTFNVCSPDHPTRMDIYTMASEISGLEMPHFIQELTKWKLIDGNEVCNKLNYKYLVNNWSEFLTPDKL
ncbi:MAG: NAD-dependent epimerase/dehydratase family protein [Pedobacter sp.]|nr:MAG: NAD-dependent epimerase/dehydratase family protein [Pedobacter sp.]